MLKRRCSAPLMRTRVKFSTVNGESKSRRRLYAKYMVKKAEHLAGRVKEVEGGKYEKMLKKLGSMKTDDVKKLYVEREREPDMSEPGVWLPEEKKHL